MATGLALAVPAGVHAAASRSSGSSPPPALQRLERAAEDVGDAAASQSWCPSHGARSRTAALEGVDGLEKLYSPGG